MTLATQEFKVASPKDIQAYKELQEATPNLPAMQAMSVMDVVRLGKLVSESGGKGLENAPVSISLGAFSDHIGHSWERFANYDGQSFTFVTLLTASE